MYFSKLLNIYGLTDYNIIYEFAKMSHNVYYPIGDKTWLNTTLSSVFDISVSNDTIRSYLFTDKTHNVAVIAFKGTSVYWTGGYTNANKNANTNDNTGNVSIVDTSLQFKMTNDKMCSLSTYKNDKFNDNLFFSCCFYKQSSLFEACECREKTICCKSCYQNSTSYEMNYINLIHYVIDKSRDIINLENTNLYFTGHSLGGMLANVASVLYDKPAVTFETPGDKHYLNLIGIDSKKVYHFGHNADPIFTGNCGRTCSMVGYNIDTKCHTGKTCTYDAKGKLGYTESILNHRIEYIVKNVIPHWENDFPECKSDDDCTECTEWTYE
jgi:lipase ATG15